MDLALRGRGTVQKNRSDSLCACRGLSRPLQVRTQAFLPLLWEAEVCRG